MLKNRRAAPRFCFRQRTLGERWHCLRLCRLHSSGPPAAASLTPSPFHRALAETRQKPCARPAHVSPRFGPRMKRSRRTRPAPRVYHPPRPARLFATRLLHPARLFAARLLFPKREHKPIPLWASPNVSGKPPGYGKTEWVLLNVSGKLPGFGKTDAPSIKP